MGLRPVICTDSSPKLHLVPETFWTQATVRGLPYCWQLASVIIYNSNRHDSVYGAVIMAKPLPEFTRFIRWMQNSAGQPPIFGLSQFPAYSWVLSLWLAARLLNRVACRSFHKLMQSCGARRPSVCPSVCKHFAQIASSTRQMAGSRPNLHTMVPRRACI